MPDFFIVGHHKTGTSALYEMLRRHPQVFMPDLKEPHFLASERSARFQDPRGRVLPETLEDYLSLFTEASSEQLVGEASASYLWSQTAASRIAEVQPDARIIAILREPASFLRSLHLQLLRNHFEETKDFKKAMSLEAARRKGKRIPRRCPVPLLLLYSDHVHYVEQLSRFHAVFPPDRVLVLIYDDFRRDNEATVRRVLRFLEVDDEHPIEELDVNTTWRSMRSPQLDNLVYSASMGRGPVSRSAKTAVKALTSRRLRHGAVRAIRPRVVFGEPPPPDERFMMQLRQRFKPEVVALSEYLDRDLVTLWGYQDVD